MKNLIPYFIQEQYMAGCYGGSLNACAIFVDISGFTQTTEALMEHGKEGGTHQYY